MNGPIAERGPRARLRPSGGYVEPEFASNDPDDRLHYLKKDFAKFGRGLNFLLVDSGSAPGSVQGVNVRSAVYEISLLHFAAGDRNLPQDLIAAIASAPDNDGWALVNDRYFDRRIAIDPPVDADAIPIATSTSAGDPNFSRFRYNADLVVRYRWHRPGSRGFDPVWVRQSRRDVTALIRWLATPPSDRDATQSLIVGKPPA